MDVIVVGGGASGLVSAINAKRRGANVLVLERNSSCGKKILVTGNGKCNYYNSNQDISHYHSSSTNNINCIINNKNNKLLLDFFDSIGIIPYIKNGYYYPHSNQAVTVLNALINECMNLGIEIINNCYVDDIIKENNKFIIKSNNGEYISDKLIISTGSYSYYKNIINSYDIASSMGHSIIKPLPALTGLISSDKIVKKWAGVRSHVIISLYCDNKFIKEEEGEVTFTDYGISGICSMQLSSYISRFINNGSSCYVSINFSYDIASGYNELLGLFNNYSRKVSNISIFNMLDNILNYKLTNAILDRLNIDRYIKWDNMDNKLKKKLIDNIINFKIDINGVRGFEYSQTTTGGIDVSEINLNTMESLIVKNLYFTGEIIDIDGDCGGYNLTFAWISGIIAGKSTGDSND